MKVTKDRLGAYLLEQGKITRDMLHNSAQQSLVSHEPLGSILVRNGFITQRDKIKALQEVDIDLLSDESTVVTRCPAQALIDTQTMILVEENKEVWIASRQDRSDVERRLEPYYRGFKIHWNPVDLEKLDDYLSKIESMSRKNIDRLDWLLKEGLLIGASDIHVQPKSGGTYAVFMRVDGVLQHRYEGPIEEYGRVAAKIKTRGNIDAAEHRTSQDGKFSIDHNGRQVDLRVATMPSTDGEKLTLRILDPDSVEKDLDGVGISRVSEWRVGMKEKSGFCLVCGKTGSGKTSSIYATMNEINRFEQAIYTIENPVEFTIHYATQINVNPDTGMTFERAVRDAMRADPDVIMIGEIRDYETAHAAIQAAETGHLVVASMHTESIGGAFQRLKDLGVNINDLKGLMRSVLVQNLVKKVCDSCHGAGCSHCEETGSRGRTLISEVNYFSSAQEVIRAADGEISWPTMNDDLIKKYEEGFVSRDTVVNFGTSAERALLEHEKNKNKSEVEV